MQKYSNNYLSLDLLAMFKKYLTKLQTFRKITEVFSTKLLWVWSFLNLLSYKKEYDLVTKSGIILSVADKDGFAILNEIFCDKVYTKHRSIRQGDTVIDIGANLGAFSVFAGASAKDVRVFSFEPMPDNYKRLLKNIRQNGLEEQIKAFETAVAGDTNGRRLFLGDAHGHNTTNPERENLAFDSSESKTCDVASTTLTKILKENNLNKNIFVKMDCEGAEYEIVKNVSDEDLLKIDYLSLEYHDGPERLEKRFAHLPYSLVKEPHDEKSGMLYVSQVVN